MTKCFARSFLLAVTLFPAWVANARADMISIINPSFEDQPLPLGVDWGSIQGWTSGTDNISGIGTWNAAPSIFDKSTLDGNQHAYLNGGSIAQQLTTGLVLGETYHISALLGTGWSLNFLFAGTLELWADGTVADGNVNGGTLLGSLVVQNTDLVLGHFVLFQTDIIAPTSGLLGGKPLSIRFTSNGRESEIDDIQLSTVDSAAAPEPTSLALFGIGAMGMLFGLGRRRQQTTAA